MDHSLVQPSEALRQLGSSANGLSHEEAQKRLKQYGLNELQKKRATPRWQVFLRQFNNFLVIILIAAGLVSAAMGEWVDASVIMAIVVINGVLGFMQESKAERVMEQLRKLSSPKAIVVREGKHSTIDAIHLVPGDIVVLSEGTRVPADCRVIQSRSLRIDESMLTGESLPVEKVDDALAKEVALADRNNMAYMGTVVTYGGALAVVTATGMGTEMGRIAGMIEEIKPEATPMQRKLAELGKLLGLAIIAVAAFVTLAGVMKGIALMDMFLIGVSLAVAAIPEGLPAVVTLTLALGMQKMARKNAIVRKLPAVETLGAATVICSDKTGTMTQNEMTVRELYTHERVTVTGEGYAPEGRLSRYDAHEELLVKAGLMCNNAYLENGKLVGDPTEGALVVLAEKAGLRQEMRREYELVKEVPFDSTKKYMTTVHKYDGKTIAFTKGAPEVVLGICSQYYEKGEKKRMTDKKRDELLKANNDMASRALRVLAFAYKEGGEGLTFLGFAGMIDPPRPEVRNAVSLCHSAGIKVVMITGDHLATAKAVAHELGIETAHAMTGEQLDKLSDGEFAKRVEETHVYARVSPEHKLRIVNALKANGEVVAMTGDGVNDAPAIKRADIGIAMGITGTDIAKEASDVVLQDDDFATIVTAVAEGRNIFSNIREFITYLLSCNIGEVLTIFMGIMLFPVAPLLPLQILWMNLITDGLPAIALGIDPIEKDVMQRKPRNRNERTITFETFNWILGIGIIMCFGTLFVMGWEMWDGSPIAKVQTMAFTTLVMFQLFIVPTMRTSKPFFVEGLFRNRLLWLAVLSSLVLQLVVVYTPFLQPIFKTVPLGVFDWIKVVAVSSIGFLAIETAKIFSRK